MYTDKEREDALRIKREHAVVHIYTFLKLKGYKTVQKLLIDKEEE